MSYVSRMSKLLLIVEPISGVFVGPLYQQPNLMAVDEQVRQSHFAKEIILTAQLLLSLETFVASLPDFLSSLYYCYRQNTPKTLIYLSDLEPSLKLPT